MRLFICFFTFLFSGFVINQTFYKTDTANVIFQSDAKLELIKASSNSLKGIIETKKRAFAFSVPISSFVGFNSPLQRQHFNENYMESHLYRRATFTGKIIEKIDLEKDGVYKVRTKGKLTIHGITRERIIKSQLSIKDGKFLVESSFSILLSEHDIDIPKVVRQKITEEVQVFINGDFERK